MRLLKAFNLLLPLLHSFVSPIGAQIMGPSSAKEALAAGSTAFQACLNEAGRLASTYGPAAATKANRIVTEHGPRIAGAAQDWAAKNPILVAGATVSTAGVAVVVAPGLVSLPILSGAGFGAGGVAGGSLAAGVQSSIGNVVAGSAFATLQSAGAGGAGLVIVNGVVQLGGAVVTAAGGILAAVKSKL